MKRYIQNYFIALHNLLVCRTYSILPEIIRIFMIQIWILKSWWGLSAGTVSLKLVFAKTIEPLSSFSTNERQYGAKTTIRILGLKLFFLWQEKRLNMYFLA